MANESTECLLLGMPLEVVLNITDYLTTPDYGRLRATCKHLEMSLFKSFAKEFFTKRQFILTEFSLRALVDISRSRFAEFVQYLIITLERPLTPSFHSFHPDDLAEPANARKSNRFIEEVNSHLELIDTGYDLELMTEALPNLTNLVTIGMRDFNSHGRFRDDGDNKWHSYGVPTFLEQTSSPQDRPRNAGILMSDINRGSGESYVCHVFLTILRALANTAAHVQPLRFEVILRYCQVPDRVFHLPRHLEAKIAPVLERLEALYLDLETHRRQVMVAGKSRPESFAGYFLFGFLLKTSSLQHLRLNFKGYDSAEAAAFLAHLAKDPPMQSATAGSNNILPLPGGLPLPLKCPDFPNLKQLDIGMVNVSESILIDVFNRYKATLRSISLHRVNLAVPAERTREKINWWSRFCQRLSKLDFAFTTISFSDLGQVYRGGRVDKVYFSPDPMNPGNLNATKKSWRGMDTASALKDFGNEMSIRWLPGDDSEEGEYYCLYFASLPFSYHLSIQARVRMGLKVGDRDSI
ncbi:hypothetical protein F4778DRAFT_755990 [Xylariomycetidae sp. FL2044]|nr:hypothetical protein F4778DRAFT_755990 [Xylariomycetidae sp. FL2044]